MKARKIGYWVTTGLVAVGFLAGGAFDLAGTPTMIAALTHLGYPAYFAALIGTWKVLGALAVVAPGFPRLKEWAYAGMVFDLTGAFVSHAAMGDGVDKLMPPLWLLALVATSWALRPESRKLQGAHSEAQPKATQRDVKWTGAIEARGSAREQNQAV
jgi:uncharacterized membrane protein YphA (DoxX/SURF4 family)